MPRKKDYSKLSKDELIAIIEKLEKKKKYGLVWDAERVPERVVLDCKENLPVLTEVKGKEIFTSDDEPTHILIEGDNYHALSVLNYTHHGKIDVIYIDPPYNTGARDWKYNNNFVEETDTLRHSKWIQFMHSRLVAARDLLRENGVLIVTIDKNENANLLVLLREVFGGHDVTTVVIEHNPKGLPSRNFSESHEYAHFVIPKGRSVIGKNPEEREDTRNLRRAGRASYRTERRSMFYPIYVLDGRVVRIGEVPDDDFHPEGRAIRTERGEIEVWPIDDHGRERRWHFGLDSIGEHIERIEVKERDGDVQLYVTALPGRYKTVWTGGAFDAGKYGTSLVKEMIGVEFPFPKSLYATERCLEAVIHTRKNALVLDFFAGSGTTGHAVLTMNAKDGGKRQFILCTNSENDICRQITYPRLTKAMTGYTNSRGVPVPGINSNLRYFKTNSVKSTANLDQVRINVTKKCTEMLCLREGVYRFLKEGEDWKIFEQGERFLGVYYNFVSGSINELRDEMNALEGDKVLYCFTVDPQGLRKEDFADWSNTRLEPIPQKILDVYRQLFKDQ